MPTGPTILSIDPGSKVTGYAIMRRPADLIEAGILRPIRAADPANVRIRTIAAELAELLRQVKPAAFIIEDTSGKVARRHGRGGGAGLAIYGKSLGYYLAVADTIIGAAAVHAVLENVWTAGIKKEKRQQRIAATFKAYDVQQDPGGDVADAIGLGLWWLTEQRLKELAA